jgi:hypothetical protein
VTVDERVVVDLLAVVLVTPQVTRHQQVLRPSTRY